MGELDIHTMLGLLAVLNIFLGLVMVVYWRTQRVYPGFGLWTLCNACVAVMWILFFFRARIPFAVAVLLPNTLAGVALMLRLEGLRRFLGRPRFDYRALAIPAAILASYLVFVYAYEDVYARTAVTTFAIGMVVWAMAALVLTRASRADRFTFYAIGAMWLLYGMLNVARGVYWLAVYEGAPLLEPGFFNEFYYVSTVVFDIGWTVVFITMNHQRTALDLETAQVAAETSRDRLANIIQFLPDATFAVDRERRVIAWNRAAEELIDLPASEVLGKSYGSVVGPVLGERRPILLDLALDPSMPVPDSYSAVTRDGDTVSAEVDPIEISGRSISVWGTASTLRDARGEIAGAIECIRDVTELKRSERQRAELLARILEGKRLESLGAMAGGISHDYNNLLAIILGSLELAGESIAPGSDQASFIDEAKRATLRAAELTEYMRAYSRGGSTLLTPLNLATFVADSRVVLEAIANHGVGLELVLDDTPPIEGDPAGILQLLTVLVTNAVEAMVGRPGHVQISTGTMECDDDCIARSTLREKPVAGQFAYIRVSDGGNGMEQETMGRMFDPFFTTKFPGRGLGLSAVSGIVAAHRGAIVVDSRLGVGTVFTVLLPIVGEEGSCGGVNPAQAPHAAAAKAAGRYGLSR